MRYFIATLLTTAALFSANLTFSHGSVTAHTGVTGDSNIDPSSSKIKSHLTMKKGDIKTLRGPVDISLVALRSDNKDRDAHMRETLNTAAYTNATYTINSVTKQSGDSYKINGTLSLHGVVKNISLSGIITKESNSLTITASTSFKMSSFGIKPPSFLIVSVRDRVDIDIDTTYKIGK